jgi:hypothetical protein
MIPTLKDWTAGTSKGLLSKRGTRLKALDSAIENYHKARSATTRDAVGEAWENWKKNHPEIFGDKGSQRNKNAMLDLLEAEFSPEGLEKIKNCSMSRIRVSLQPKPVGFPAYADEGAVDRIDKAMLDAQGVLRSTIRRLKRRDATAVENVKLWFANNSADALLKRYEKVLDHVDTKLKGGAVPLEIRWSDQPDNVASTGYGSNYISFGPSFFDDTDTVPSWNLTGKPLPPPDYLVKAQGVIAEWEKLAKEATAHQDLAGWLKSPGDTVEDCAKAALKRSSFNSTRAMLAAIAPLGFSGTDGRDDAQAMLDRQVAANAARSAEMLQDAKSRRAAVSASGVIVHELTHMVLDTKDVQSPLFAAAMPCYGPGLCLHLAKVKPDDAFNNADNYRLFAECCQFD